MKLIIFLAGLMIGGGLGFILTCFFAINKGEDLPPSFLDGNGNQM